MEGKNGNVVREMSYLKNCIRFTFVCMNSRFILTEMLKSMSSESKFGNIIIYNSTVAAFIHCGCDAIRRKNTKKQKHTRNCRNFWRTNMSNINVKKDKFSRWFMTTGWVGTPWLAWPQPNYFKIIQRKSFVN